MRLGYARPVASAITGHTGVLHAGAQLSHRGWVVSLTLAGAPRTDIFAQQALPPGRLVAVQVKAEQGGGFFLGPELAQSSHEEADEWFVLVSLREPAASPAFFILPRAHIAAAVGTALACFGSSYRQLGAQNFEGYAGCWESMESAPLDAPWRLPRWHWDHRHKWPEAEDAGMPIEPPPDAPVV